MFCDQCGTRVPDQAVTCPNCGAQLQQAAAPVQNAAPVPNVNMEQPVQQNAMPVQNAVPVPNVNMEQSVQQNAMPVQNAVPVPNANMGQPVQQNAMPMQNAVPVPNANMGQPMQQMNPGYPGQQMYQAQPVQQPNPLAFLTAVHPGEPFPLKGIFSVKKLLSRITTIDLIGVVSAVLAFICVFLPVLTRSYWGESSSINMISSEANEGGMMGWMVIVLSIVMAVLYAVRMEFLAFLVSLLNLLMFIHVWTLGGAAVDGSYTHYGVGFYFYLIATIMAVISPFIWMKVKKS